MRYPDRARLLLVRAAIAAGPAFGMASAHPGLDHDLHRATHAVKASPRDPGVYVQRARLYRLAGAPQAALDDLESAAALSTRVARLHLERGLALSDLERDDEALAELDYGIAEGGDEPAVYAARARLLQRAGRIESAIQDMDSAIARHPRVDAYLERGQWLESTGRLEEAAEGYRDGLNCLGGAVLLRLALVRVESERNRPEAALALIDEVLGDAAVKTEWLIRRAQVLVSAGRSEDARRELQRALHEAERALARKATPLNRRLKAKVVAAMEGAFLPCD